MLSPPSPPPTQKKNNKRKKTTLIKVVLNNNKFKNYSLNGSVTSKCEEQLKCVISYPNDNI